MKKLLSALIFVSFLSTAAYQGSNPEISPEKLLKQSQTFYIVDVRSPSEYAEGHVPGAINIPHYAIVDNIDKLKAMSDKDIVIYCRSGRRAWSAEQAMMKSSITNLRHLQGDMNLWMEKGLPLKAQK